MYNAVFYGSIKILIPYLQVGQKNKKGGPSMKRVASSQPRDVFGTNRLRRMKMAHEMLTWDSVSYAPFSDGELLRYWGRKRPSVPNL